MEYGFDILSWHFACLLGIAIVALIVGSVFVTLVSPSPQPKVTKAQKDIILKHIHTKQYSVYGVIELALMYHGWMPTISMATVGLLTPMIIVTLATKADRSEELDAFYALTDLGVYDENGMLQAPQTFRAMLDWMETNPHMEHRFHELSLR